MADERQVMYDKFNHIGKHSVQWVWITKEFLKLAFAGSRREASCMCVVRTKGCCRSMRCLLTLLRGDLC
jgi:hypothetical protein